MKTCDHPSCPYPVFSKGKCRYHIPRTAIPKTKKKIRFGRKDVADYTKSQVKKDLNVMFCAWTRMRDADEAGIVFCISCGKINHWTKGDAGHYIPRSLAPALIFNEDNTKFQCKICNWLEGNRIKYRENLIRKIGRYKVELLEAAQHQKSNIGLFEMKIMLWDYIEKFKLECERLGHTPNTTQQKVLNRWQTKPNENKLIK